jgi:hypothetical protein
MPTIDSSDPNAVRLHLNVYWRPNLFARGPGRYADNTMATVALLTQS